MKKRQGSPKKAMRSMDPEAWVWKRAPYLALLAVVVLPILNQMASLLIQSLNTAKNIATVEYVDHTSQSDRKFAEDKIKEVEKDLNDHTDGKIAQLTLKIESEIGDLKSDVKSFGKGQDMMMESLKSIQAAQLSDPRRAR